MNAQNLPNVPESSLSFPAGSSPRLEEPSQSSRNNVPLYSYLRTPACKSSWQCPAHPHLAVPTTLRDKVYEVQVQETRAVLREDQA